MRKPSIVILLLSFHAICGEELYVDEIGDSDIIPIETDAVAIAQVDTKANIVKRQVDKHVEPSYGTYDYYDDEEQQIESSGYDDLDGYDTEDDDFGKYIHSTKVNTSIC